MEVKGYKAFNIDQTNRYGMHFEEGQTYQISQSEVKFGPWGYGFHLCTHLADVFRYYEYLTEDICIAEVTGRETCQNLMMNIMVIMTCMQ